MSTEVIGYISPEFISRKTGKKTYANFSEGIRDEYEHNQRLDAMQREIDEAKIAIEREKEEAEREKEEVERQKEEAERQKAAAEQEKIKAEKEREIVRQENFKLKKALKLLAQQNPGEEVYKLMGITREELDQLINVPPHVV